MPFKCRYLYTTAPEESRTSIIQRLVLSHVFLCCGSSATQPSSTADIAALPMPDQPREHADFSPRGGRPGRHFWPHLSRAVRRTLFCSYTSVLLVFVPIGIAAGFLGWPAVAVFLLNVLAIIPLAPIIAFSIDELALGVAHVFGKFLKATSGNAVEMAVGLFLCCDLITLADKIALLSDRHYCCVPWTDPGC
jgi:hypothetical protein